MTTNGGIGGLNASGKVIKMEVGKIPLWESWTHKGRLQEVLEQLLGLLKQRPAVSTRTVTKPKMRGLLKSQIQRNLITGFLLSALSGYAFKVFVCDERRRNYADFYRNYNAEEVFEDMRKKRLFQSC